MSREAFEKLARQSPQLKGEAKLRAELAKAYKDIESLSVAELAARNQDVADYCKHWEDRALKAEAALATAAAAAVPPGYKLVPVDELSAIRKIAADAATSLETISMLAGRKSYGEPPIETFMDTFSDVRMYAAARAKAARDDLSMLEAAPKESSNG